ncbi:hypothetical protein MRX96_045052 [Rhipicephalus microplus]
MRFGAPAIIQSDNDPQFASAQLKAFFYQWRSSHITSSPYFPQSNVAAERTIQTTKQLIRKSPKIRKALLTLRDTPGKEKFISVKLLVGWRLRTDMPVAPHMLKPRWSTVEFRKRNKVYEAKQGTQYNRSNRTLVRDAIKLHTAVRRLSGTPITRTVIGPEQTPYSYIQSAVGGGLTRPTSKHLQPLQQVTKRSGRMIKVHSKCNVRRGGKLLQKRGGIVGATRERQVYGVT